MVATPRPAPMALGVAVLLAVALLLPPLSSPAGSAPSPGRVRIAFDGPVLSPELPLAPRSVEIPLTITLLPADAAQLHALDARLAGARAPGLAPFLTERSFESEFSPPPEHLAQVEQYFRAHGASGFQSTPDRFGLRFALPASEIPGALGVHLRLAPGALATGARYGPDGVPTLPAGLAAFVDGVGGLSNAAVAVSPLLHSRSSAGDARAALRPSEFVDVVGSGTQLLFGSDIAQAYGLPALFPTPNGSAGTFPTGEAVATILTSGYNLSTGTDLPPFDPSVVHQYFVDTFPSTWPIPNVTGVPVPIGASSPPAPGPLGPLGDDSLSQTENALDLEMAGSMAPGASLTTFYFAESAFASLGSGSYGAVADDFSTALSEALSHDYGSARLVAVTNSYGLPDLNDTLWNTELAHAAAVGVTVVAASGDQGDAPNSLTGRIQGAGPVWPGSAAFSDSGVVSVGGTTLRLAGTPTESVDPSVGLNATFDPNVSGIASEVGWYDTSGGSGDYAGSEGGVSPVYPEPSWQFASAAQPAIVNATIQAGLGALGRAVPDLSLVASDVVVYDYANTSGVYFDILSGTSVSAPLFAGLLASCAAVDGHPFGFLDPWLYRLGSLAGGAAAPTAGLRDVTQGSNYLYSAAPGWDAMTGWGSPEAASWPGLLTNSSVANYSYPGPTPGLPPYHPPAGVGGSGPPLSPVALAAVLGAVGAGLGIALYVALRGETPSVLPPPPGAFGEPSAGPHPPPPRPVCGRCGRERVPWLAVCPWCGMPGN